MTAAELGLVGGAAFVLGVVSGVFWVWRRLVRSPKHAHMVLLAAYEVYKRHASVVAKKYCPICGERVPHVRAVR